MAVPKGRLVTPVGFDPTGNPLALEVDAAGFLKVVFLGAAQGLVGTHGYVNAAWYKNPIQFGYSTTLGIAVDNLSIPAGNSNQNSSAVPAGWIWVITGFQFIYIGTPPAVVQIALSLNGSVIRVYRQLTPASGVGYDRQGWWVLKEGDYAQMQIIGGTLNDDIYFHAAGFAVQINL